MNNRFANSTLTVALTVATSDFGDLCLRSSQAISRRFLQWKRF